MDRELRKSFNNAMGCFGAISIVLPLMKLIGHIDISWVLVTLPLWLSIVCPIIPLTLVGILTLLFYIIKIIIRPTLTINH